MIGCITIHVLRVSTQSHRDCLSDDVSSCTSRSISIKKCRSRLDHLTDSSGIKTGEGLVICAVVIFKNPIEELSSGEIESVFLHHVLVKPGSDS
jgi:hypothetical protein